MAFVLGIIYLLLSLVSTHVITQLLVYGTTFGASTGRVQRTSVRFAAFGVVFFMPFYAVGASELVWEWPRISLVSLTSVQAALAIFAMTCNRWVPWIAKRGTPLAIAREGSPSFRRRRLSDSLLIVTTLLFVLLGCMLMTGFPRGFEVAAYHLPIAVDMFQSGSMRVWDSAYMHTFPANMSAFSGFFLQFLPERIASILNLPFLALACFVVYGLSRLAGGDSGASQLAAVGLISIPVVTLSGFEVGSDIGGIAFLGLGYLIVMSSPRDRASWIFLAGLCIGLAYGFKSLHVVGGGLLGLYVMIRALKGREAVTLNRRLVRAFEHGGIFACGFLLSAGFWLLRNFIELGNPVYPVHLGALFDMLGWSSAPDFDISSRSKTEFEWVRNSWEWAFYPWVEWHFIEQNFKHSSGFGAFFAAFVPIAWLAGMAQVLSRLRSASMTENETKSHTNSALLVISSLAIVVVWWGLGDRQPRYLMGAIILAVPLVAKLITRMAPSYRRIMEVLVVICISVMLLVISSKQTIEFVSRFIVSKQYSRAEFYEYPVELDRLPSGSVVLNLSSRVVNYSLFGNRLSNRVLIWYRAEALLRKNGTDQLTWQALTNLGVSHIYTQGRLRVRVDPCVVLKEAARLDRNPTNGRSLSEPGVLYALSDVRRCRENIKP